MIHDELSQMQEQIAMLRQKLNKQEIINQRLVGKAIQSNVSDIRRRMIIVCLVGIFAVFSVPIVFYNFGFRPYTYTLAVILLIYELIVNLIVIKRVSAFVSKNSNMLDFVAQVEDVLRFRRINKRIGFACVAILFAMIIYNLHTIMGNSSEFILCTTSCLVGGVIGGIIGLIVDNRVSRSLRCLRDEIATLGEYDVGGGKR